MLVRRKSPGCSGLLLVWLASATAVWLTAALLPGVDVADFRTALVVALLLGLLNAIVRPLLVLLTLPVTLLTLGLFLVVINALLLGMTASLVEGFSLRSPWDALAGAVVLGLVSGLVSWLMPDRRA